jgi:hypothetical protein
MRAGPFAEGPFARLALVSFSASSQHPYRLLFHVTDDRIRIVDDWQSVHAVAEPYPHVLPR